jgi:hypothetical protein
MRNPWKLTSIALAALLAASLGNTFVSPAAADAQPKMRAALDSLRAAKASLDEATPDKGGHRVKAIQLTKQAIDQVEAGIKFDNKH